MSCNDQADYIPADFLLCRPRLDSLCVADFTPRAYFSTTRQSLLTSAPRTAHQLHRFTTVSPSPAYNRPHINHPSPFSRSRSIRSFRFDFPNRSSAKRIHTDQTNSVQDKIPLEGATDGLARGSTIRPRSPQGWGAWRGLSGRSAGIFFGAALFATAVRFKWQYLLSGATMTLLAVLSHKIYKGSLLERRMKIFWVALKVFLDYKVRIYNRICWGGGTCCRHFFSNLKVFVHRSLNYNQGCKLQISLGVVYLV